MMGDLSEALAIAQGRTIRRARLGKRGDEPWDEPALLIDFADGSGLWLYDDGQSCCEHRYLHTDDELTAFTGATFLGARVQDGPSVDYDSGAAHDVQFLIVDTSLGSFTIETHNEHNGYYGGFNVEADVVAAVSLPTVGRGLS